MDVREQRGREIAERLRIEKKGNAWVVPSQSGKGTYRVTNEANELHCTCADFELRAKPCKHIWACAVFVQQQTTVTETTVNGVTEKTTVTETKAVRITYAQNWRAYNQAQTKEKAMFCGLLRDLAVTVPEHEQTMGRPRMPIADAIFSTAFKVYTNTSARRFSTDLREAHANGLVSKPWHFNSVLGALEDETLTPILYDLVTASAAPLASVESTFAIDSTGFGTTVYYNHYTAKYGREIAQHDWLKLHACIGTTTNVIASASVTDRNASDTPQYVPLLQAATPTFAPKVVTADKAYGSRINVRHTAAIGAAPYIALKSNTVGYNTQMMTYKADDSAWRALWHLYNLRRDEFLATYHARSNVESTFSSMKRVFGDTLRSKTRVAQTNELLLKVIVHNIVCLVHSIFELGIEVPNFRVKGAA